MELRAHHLLCIPMYQGYGYSEEFCAHMEKMIERIKTTEEPIRPLASPDEVCTHCPHLQPAKPRQGNARMTEAQPGTESDRAETPESALPFLKNRYCEHEEQTSRKDSHLLESFGLCCGREYGREELKQTVLANMTEETFQKSCGRCEWLKQGLCSFRLWKDHFKTCF